MAAMRLFLTVAFVSFLSSAASAAEFVDSAEAGDWELVLNSVDADSARLTQGDASTALHWAAHWNHADAAKRLLEAGAVVDAANDYGVTPLAVACRVGNFEVAAVLLKAGAEPSIELAGRETLLMHAARAGEARTRQEADRLRTRSRCQAATRANRADVGRLSAATLMSSTAC